MPADPTPAPLRDKLNLETAQIEWPALERLFASGLLLVVAAGEDLVEMAALMAEDRAEAVQACLADGRLAQVSDAQARRWQAGQTRLWAVVIKPWVLVQEPVGGNSAGA